MEYWNLLLQFVTAHWHYGITVISVIWGVFQYINKRKLERSIAHKVIALYSNIDISLGAVQLVRGKITNDVNSAMYETGRCEGLTNAALIHCADIYCNLMGTSVEDIDEMCKKGMIRNGAEITFKPSSEMRSGLWSRILKRLI